MKHLKSYKIFESRFVEFREVVSTIKDICQEFEDNNCECKIFPQDDIKLNIVYFISLITSFGGFGRTVNR